MEDFSEIFSIMRIIQFKIIIELKIQIIISIVQDDIIRFGMDDVKQEVNHYVNTNPTTNSTIVYFYLLY